MAFSLSEQDWQIRLELYRLFVESGHPPPPREIAQRFGLPDDDVRCAFRRLHHGHAILLEPGTDNVRMANPLSAVPTPYQVRVNSRVLSANCAWDSLGIPAMLAVDAQIEARISASDGPVRYAIEQGELRADDRLVVHFPLPFRDWYADLIHT